jgi:hypothetical protein
MNNRLGSRKKRWVHLSAAKGNRAHLCVFLHFRVINPWLIRLIGEKMKKGDEEY